MPKTCFSITAPDALNCEQLEPRNMLSAVDVIAAGTTGVEEIELRIDGALIQTWNDIGDGADGATFVTRSHETPATITPGQVSIHFVNDLYDQEANIDRNVRIDAIVIDGVRYESEATDVYSTGTWLPADGIVPGFGRGDTLHANGSLQFADPDIGGEGTAVQIRALGSEGGETFELQVDGSTVANFVATTTSQVYSYQSSSVITANQIRVRFTGDQYDELAGVDANLRVAYLSVDGQTFETDSALVYSTGTWLNGDIVNGFGRGDTLHVNGYFQYASPSQSTGSTIIVQASGSEGGESFDLQIANQIVASFAATTTFQPFSYQAADEVTADQVRVVFTGDRYDEVNGIDANLNVDFVSIDGQILETESTSVFSTGVWQDGAIADGYGRGETLHVNGYFQYAVETTPEPSHGSFALSLDYYPVVKESDGTISMTIHRVGGSAGSTSIDYSTVAISAEAGLDYTEQSGTLLFADGQTSQTIQIQIVSDTVAEADELFSFVLENPLGGADLLAPRSVSIRITENDGPQEPGVFAPGVPELANVQREILAQVPGAVAVEFTPDGKRLLIAEFGGYIYVYDLVQNVLHDTPLVDIADQVNSRRGLLDIALHPDFENTPYVYLAFAYDPPELQGRTGLAAPDGDGNRASRLIRVTADINDDYLSTVPGSEVILVGKNSTIDYFNPAVDSTVDFDEPPGGVLPDGSYVQDFLAADSETHTIGAVKFGPDGMLYVANGDGASYNATDPRAARVQDIDSLSGKILRIDPITGRGLADNPFYNVDSDSIYNQDLDSNRSKVYQLGFRNPFRMSFDDTTGQLYVGDVGWTQWEEINTGPAGANFGWPYYEGGHDGLQKTAGYRDLPEAAAFYANHTSIQPPLLGLHHANDQIDAIILGDFYTGGTLPPEYSGHLIFGHLSSGAVRAVELAADGAILSVKTLFYGPSYMTQIVSGPSGHLYFVDFATGEIGRWVLTVT